jgi:hypothetical protein
MAEHTRIVFDLKDLELLMEQVRVDLLSAPLSQFMGRTDDDTVEDFNLVYEAVAVVLDEVHRSQRKVKQVVPSAPVTIAITTTAA